MQLRPQMTAEMRPKRIEFGYFPSNSKVGNGQLFRYFRFAFGFGQIVLPGNSVAVRIAAVELVEV